MSSQVGSSAERRHQLDAIPPKSQLATQPPSTAFARLGRTMYRWRWWVIGAWIIAVLAAADDQRAIAAQLVHLGLPNRMLGAENTRRTRCRRAEKRSAFRR